MYPPTIQLWRLKTTITALSAMKVLYIGYAKTGTKTMNAVFRSLGYKCYDYQENAYYLGDEWCKILKYGGTKEDFRKMYENVDAAVDTPIPQYWDQIVEAFPDVKLIVSYRDEESWLSSWKNQVAIICGNLEMKFGCIFSPTARRMSRFSRIITKVCLNGKDSIFPWRIFVGIDFEKSLESYRKHNANVLAKTPNDRLLTVKFEEGWAPICKFLDKPIPTKPFPHCNKNGSLVQDYLQNSPIFSKMRREAYARLFSLIAVLFCACLWVKLDFSVFIAF